MVSAAVREPLAGCKCPIRHQSSQIDPFLGAGRISAATDDRPVTSDVLPPIHWLALRLRPGPSRTMPRERLTTIRTVSSGVGDAIRIKLSGTIVSMRRR